MAGRGRETNLWKEEERMQTHHAIQQEVEEKPTSGRMKRCKLIMQYCRKRKRNQPLEGGEVAITHFAIHQDEEEKKTSGSM